MSDMISDAMTLIEADRKKRLSEFDEIVMREAIRLRCKFVAIVEKVMVSDGIYADKAVVKIVAE